jgi:hypothetical protein
MIGARIAVKEKSSTVMVEILLPHGADPNVGDNRGLSCLNKAKDNAEVIR